MFQKVLEKEKLQVYCILIDLSVTVVTSDTWMWLDVSITYFTAT